MPAQRLRVLFLCTGNAARSQMAEAILRQLSNGRVEVHSAGSVPADRLHPLAKEVLEHRFHIDTYVLRPKSLEPFLLQPFDFVITVCDRAAEACPIFPGHPTLIHWSFEDPVPLADSDTGRRAFEQTANGLAARMRIWLSLPEIRRRLEAADQIPPSVS